nr:hypothetical protein [Rhodovastum atsumiense]
MAALHARIHLGFEEAPAATPVLLGPIQRHARPLEQRIGIDPIRRREADADAGADDDLVALQLERRAERLDHPAGQAGSVLRLVHVGLDDGELVATEPRQRVGLAQQLLQSGGNGAQQRVAHRMAERVVDFLEAVEVDQADGAAPATTRQRLVQPLAEQHPVGQAGQRVVVGEMRDMGIGLAALGDVDDHPVGATRPSLGVVLPAGPRLEMAQRALHHVADAVGHVALGGTLRRGGGKLRLQSLQVLGQQRASPLLRGQRRLTRRKAVHGPCLGAAMDKAALQVVGPHPPHGAP